MKITLLVVGKLGRTPEAGLARDYAERATAAPMGDRLDLRRVPLVTIDGEDARDFDDAGAGDYGQVHCMDIGVPGRIRT